MIDTLEFPLTLTLTPLQGAPRRLRLTESDRPGVVARLYEQEFNGRRWRTTGTEPIEHVEIDAMLRAYLESDRCDSSDRDAAAGVYTGP